MERGAKLLFPKSLENSPKSVFNEHCSLSRSSVQVDLTSVAPEVTHELWKPIKGGQVKPRLIFAPCSFQEVCTIFAILHQFDFIKCSLGPSSLSPIHHSNWGEEQQGTEGGNHLSVCK